MLDKCEIKVPKSRNYLTEWPFVQWPYVRVAFSPDPFSMSTAFLVILVWSLTSVGGSVAEWLACWTRSQKDPGSNRSRDAVG